VEYGEGLQERHVGLHDRIHSGTYRAKPSKRVWISKWDGKLRPIGIAALEDKIVQQVWSFDCEPAAFDKPPRSRRGMPNPRTIGDRAIFLGA
jgi:retron-type reverse transcriptase